MLIIGIIILALFLIAFFIGIIWRWRAVNLFIIGAVFTVVLFIALRDWSDFSFTAILHNPNSWDSWIFMLPIEFLYFAIPVGIPIFIGCVIGLLMRKTLKKQRR